MYYIAINGASCAISQIDWLSKPSTSPVAECLIGFKTLEAALQAQRICLKAPISVVRKKMEKWTHGMKRNPNAEPPTQGPTLWMSHNLETQTNLEGKN